MVASVHCDQGTQGLVASSTRQKIIPERWFILGRFWRIIRALCIFQREKGDGLWTLFRLAVKSVGGAVLGWHGARRWVVIFSYFHLGLVGGEILGSMCAGYEKDVY
jgi:hypothetical protein